MTRKKKMLPAS